jgi:hypothetical protein
VTAAELPETAAVYWRPRMDAARMARRGRAWTAAMLAHVLPLLATAALLLYLDARSAPVAAMALVQAWAIPTLYARRGANVLRPAPRAAAGPERAAAGLLGDLVSHGARELHARTGLVLEPGALGTWLVGEAGAVLVAPGGRRVHCWCVHATDRGLPSGDRVAHLLLALREDEAGFATVANLAFSGAPWRLRRRLGRAMRPALDAAMALRGPSLGGAARYAGRMENSALGNLGRRVLAWVVLIAVVVLAFKLLIGVVAGLFAAMFSILLFVVLALGVIWALRHI